MVEETSIKEDLKYIRDKLNNLSVGRKVMLLFLLLVILGSLFYLSTIDHIEVITFYKPNGSVACREVYVNGELNSSPCTEWYPKKRWENLLLINVSDD